jgi:hypothetical protein
MDVIERSRQEISWFRQMIILTNHHIAQSEASMSDAMRALKEASQYFDGFQGGESQPPVSDPSNPVTSVPPPAQPPSAGG